MKQIGFDRILRALAGVITALWAGLIGLLIYTFWWIS